MAIYYWRVWRNLDRPLKAGPRWSCVPILLPTCLGPVWKFSTCFSPSLRILHRPCAQCAGQKSTAVENIYFPLFHFTSSKKKNEKLCSEEIYIFDREKKKKTVHSGAHYVYAHF
jgi:hypothetical protein